MTTEEEREKNKCLMSSRGLIRPLTYILRLPLVLQGEVMHVHDGPPGHRLHLVALRLPVLVLLDQLVVQRLPGVRQPAALDALHAKGGVGQAILHLVGVCGGGKSESLLLTSVSFSFLFLASICSTHASKHNTKLVYCCKQQHVLGGTGPFSRNLHEQKRKM